MGGAAYRLISRVTPQGVAAFSPLSVLSSLARDDDADAASSSSCSPSSGSDLEDPPPWRFFLAKNMAVLKWVKEARGFRGVEEE